MFLFQFKGGKKYTRLLFLHLSHYERQFDGSYLLSVVKYLGLIVPLLISSLSVLGHNLTGNVCNDLFPPTGL